MRECPRCHWYTLDENDDNNALSRRDNKTYICDDCGVEEALIDAGFALPSATELNFLTYLTKTGVKNA